MFQLYFNNQLCDPPAGQQIVGSYAVNEIGQIEVRDGFYTNTFQLPLTNRNKLILENAQIVTSATNLPYQFVEARIDNDGVPNIIGFAAIISTTKKFAEILVIGGNANWLTLIGEQNLNSLDIVELNHKWEDSQVYGRRANVWQLGGNYPNADYGRFETASTTIQFYELYYGVYAKWLMRFLFNSIGVSISGDFWENNALLEKIFLPFSSKWQRDKNYQHRDRWSYVQDTTTFAGDIDSLSIPGLFGGTGTTTTDCDYDFKPSKIFDYVPSLIDVAPDDHWLILDGGVLTVNYNITLRNSTPLAQITDKCSIAYMDADGNAQTYQIADMSALPGNTTQNYTGTATLNVGRGCVFISLGTTRISAGSTADFVLVPNGENDDDLLIDDTYSYITVGSTLPDMSSMDFLRTIWNQFGLIFTYNPNSSMIRAFTLSEVLANVLNAEDWSDKIDLSVDPQISYTMDGYAQKNWFKYNTDDSDEYLDNQPGYGDAYIELNNTRLEKEKEIFVSEFAPIVRIPSFNDTREMAYIPKFIEDDENECTPRICYLEFDALNQLTIGVNPIEPTQPNLYFEDLRFVNLLEQYYTTLTTMLTKPKIVIVNLRLTKVDIANLNFKLPKYIDYFGCYFYLSLVDQFEFTANRSTPCKLIRIL